MVKHREVEFSPEYAMFLRKRYFPLYCYVCLEEFREGEIVVSSNGNRVKVRHRDCWVKMWQGNEKLNLKTFLDSKQNSEHSRRWGHLPKVPRPACPHCLSLKIYRDGIRQLKDQRIRQLWKCGSCGLQFKGMIQEEEEVHDGVTNLPHGDSLSTSPKTER